MSQIQIKLDSLEQHDIGVAHQIHPSLTSNIYIIKTAELELNEEAEFQQFLMISSFQKEELKEEIESHLSIHNHKIPVSFQFPSPISVKQHKPAAMKTHHLFFFFFLLLQTLPHFSSVLAVEYQAINAALHTPGGSRFEAEIGIPYTKEIMQTINHFIWDILQQYNDTDRKPVEVAKVFIQQYDGAEAITIGETINISSLYLQGYQGNLKWEFTSLLHHEMTHVFQWNGEGQTPVGLVEGIADYMILKSNYYPTGFAKPGQGERWDQGYDFTARFLEYCEELRSGFVAGLNKMMRYRYSEEYFVALTGKMVAQLWAEYKAKYI